MTRWLYHIALSTDWEDARAAGVYRISTRGRTLEEEGFIHMSTPAQVHGVGERYYSDAPVPLVLLTIDLTRLTDEVKLEVPPGADQAFPHLYGPLPVDAVAAVTAYRVGEGPTTRLHHTHIFASDIDATIDFWTRHLGARVMADEKLVGSRNVMLGVGDGRLNIYDQPPGHRGPIHHLGIQVRDLERVIEHMESNGFEFRKAPSPGEGFSYVMAEAPDGILLELFQADPTSVPANAAQWFSWEEGTT